MWDKVGMHPSEYVRLRHMFEPDAATPCRICRRTVHGNSARKQLDKINIKT